MLSLKIALISMGLLFIAVILKLWVPVLADFAVSEFPVMYSCVLSWLQPPYLYLVINCIIISIVASSKLQLHKPGLQPLSSQPVMVVPPPPVLVDSGVVDDGPMVMMVGSDGVYGRKEQNNKDLVEEKMIAGGDKVVVSSVQAPQRSDSMEFLIEKLEEKEKEKPLVSARFGHRKSVRASPEGIGSFYSYIHTRIHTFLCTSKYIFLLKKR